MGQGLRSVVKSSPPYGREFPSILHPGAGNNKKWERGRVKSLVSGLSMTRSPNGPEKADGQVFLWMAQEVGKEEEEVPFPFLVNDVCSNIIDNLQSTKVWRRAGLMKYRVVQLKAVVARHWLAGYPRSEWAQVCRM